MVNCLLHDSIRKEGLLSCVQASVAVAWTIESLDIMHLGCSRHPVKGGCDDFIHDGYLEHPITAVAGTLGEREPNLALQNCGQLLVVQMTLKPFDSWTFSSRKYGTAHDSWIEF